MTMWLSRSEEIARYGEYPGARSIEKLLGSGIIILDKWRGPTSRDVSSIVKKTIGASKAGHCGTLDPLVSGVLPIALGSATKAMPLLQGLDKEYVGVMKLHKDTVDAVLKSEAAKFTGPIEQLPPVRSAVKREKRKRTVHEFKIMERDNRNVLFSIKCEAGTYIRKIIHDLGMHIGGAHMTELRRTAVGNFAENRCVRMEDLVLAYRAWKKTGSEKIREYLLPVETAVENSKKIVIKDSAVYPIAHGSPLYAGGIVKAEDNIKPGDMLSVLTLRGELAAIGKAELHSEKMVKGRQRAASIDRVIIDSSLYPKIL